MIELLSLTATKRVLYVLATFWLALMMAAIGLVVVGPKFSRHVLAAWLFSVRSILGRRDIGA